MTSLLAALEASAGNAVDAYRSAQRDTKLLSFLQQVAAAYPGQELHLVVDNRATSTAVTAWLAGNPRISMHVSPPSGSWLDLVKVLLAIAGRRDVSNGAGDLIDDLSEAIGTCIDQRDQQVWPFVWAKEPGPWAEADDPIGARPASVQLAAPATGNLSPGRSTDEFTSALEAIHTRLNELDAIHARLDELAAAIETLRARPDTTPAPNGAGLPSAAGGPPAEPTATAVLGDDAAEWLVVQDWWVVRRLRQNTKPEHTRGSFGGSLAFGGIVRTPACGEVRWQSEFTLPDVLAS